MTKEIAFYVSKMEAEKFVHEEGFNLDEEGDAILKCLEGFVDNIPGLEDVKMRQVEELGNSNYLVATLYMSRGFKSENLVRSARRKLWSFHEKTVNRRTKWFFERIKASHPQIGGNRAPEPEYPKQKRV